MAKDKRLFTQIVIDLHRHPKITRLPVEVRWTYIEMLNEARIADNDGEFDADEAEFMWPVEHLAALIGSHPSRPLLQRDGQGRYVLRDYAAHQQTRAEREEVARTARENGAKGGRPPKPKQNPAETQGVSKNNPSEPSGTQTKAESESESELERPIPTELVSLGSNARANSTDQEANESARRLAVGMNVNLDGLIKKAQRLDRELEPADAIRLASIILARAKRDVRNPDAYIATTFKNEPLQVQQCIDREVLI